MQTIWPEIWSHSVSPCLAAGGLLDDVGGAQAAAAAVMVASGGTELVGVTVDEQVLVQDLLHSVSSCWAAEGLLEGSATVG